MSSKASILPSYHPISFDIHNHNSFSDFVDHYFHTNKLRILAFTFLAFLVSLWIVAEFSGTGFNIHTLRYYNKNNEAALAAASVLGEGGEEGLHGLEVENHGRIGPTGHNHEALDYYYDSEPQTKVELEIDDLVHDNPVVIFSKSYCPYSRRVKHILSMYRISPSVLIIEVDKRDDADEFKQALIKTTYRSTFPNVFIDGKSIGGSDELAIMHSNGRLSEILVDAGVLDSSETQNHEIFRPSL
ncbi:thioredoxin-like protein [Rhizophagus clarus]|uniref:Thioredoxin-like protein n=1 Tax=Rhizophagus clarus TaxID=94130 RepID=A0A8H3M876_9GLOM|nr:thioredoxin-like protein [Rhizophagus clarus]